VRIVAIDHVQLAMPAGGEPAARGFYHGVLGIPEVPKPLHLATRGGCWFESADVKVHLGVEGDFRPARKAHPGLVVNGLRELLDRCRRAGFDVVPDEPLDRRERAYVSDPFGNRIELIDASPGG
jgi:catechol 2,3-dioxygenase-like lactoylglutathione lyase family enzyme